MTEKIEKSENELIYEPEGTADNNFQTDSLCKSVIQYSHEDMNVAIELFKMLVGWRNEARRNELIDW